MYIVVCRLKNQSGFTWDEEKGLNIDVATDSTWKEYVKVHDTSLSQPVWY